MYIPRSIFFISPTCMCAILCNFVVYQILITHTQRNYMGRKHASLVFLFLLLSCYTQAQIVLLGDNPPNSPMLDGEFSMVRASWRQGKQSPFWKTTIVEGEEPMGLHAGTLFSSNILGVAESPVLDVNPAYQQVKEGDVYRWQIGANLEYVSQGTLSVALVFGDKECIIANELPLIGSDGQFEHFSGTYTVTKDDVRQGLPFVRVYFYSQKDVKVYLDYIRIAVDAPQRSAPRLEGEAKEMQHALCWATDPRAVSYTLYRKGDGKGYKRLVSTKQCHYGDADFISGKAYSYLVQSVYADKTHSCASNILKLTSTDTIAPAAPTHLMATAFDAEIRLTWKRPVDKDISHYIVKRRITNGSPTSYTAVDKPTKRPVFEDILPPKGVDLEYVVIAYDYSGHSSVASHPVRTRVHCVPGASFSDLIQPMPVTSALRSDVWGTPDVLPRDVQNGMESPKWTYWGGHPVYDVQDNKYHMHIARWPEDDIKGHWAWPYSTVAHVVSDNPIGPYTVKDDISYSYKGGLGHNPDIIHLRDGRFALYSLIDWEPTFFVSSSMNGPWKKLGVIDVDWQKKYPEAEKHSYQFYRNLAGVQDKDGRFVLVSKFGSILTSDTGILGPYQVRTGNIKENKTVPERYRNSKYEDPVMWKDEVQYHMIINAFLDYRAIHLRSIDGINWKYDTGLAFTPKHIYYENGVQNLWYKVERPHVIQDQYGRATHLSLAAIDVKKADDYGSDNHSAKNIILPLRVERRIQMLNKKSVTAETKKIRIRIASEQGFDASKEVDLASLRLGAAEVVNRGQGAVAISSRRDGQDLVVTFDGNGNGMTKDNFVCKLIGRTHDNQLVVGYSKTKK